MEHVENQDKGMERLGDILARRELPSLPLSPAPTPGFPRETHQGVAELKPGWATVKVSLDLWPGMRERDIQRLASYITRQADRVKHVGDGMAGVHYSEEG